jgi:hypothetical protein
MSQTEAFREFKKAHPNIRIKQRRFERTKPPYIYPTLRSDRIVCACQTHVNMRELYKGLIAYRKLCLEKHFVDEYEHELPLHVTDMVYEVVCGVEEEAFSFKTACAQGRCESCSLDSIDRYFHEIIIGSTGSNNFPVVSYYQFQQEKVWSRKKEKLVNHMQRVRKELDAKSFFELFKEKLRDYVEHLHVMRWQARMFKDCVKNLKQGRIVWAMDFAENYTFEERVEVQSMHWGKKQATMLVMVIWRIGAQGVDPPELVGQLIKEHHVFTSADREKDCEFVNTCIGKVLDHYAERGFDCIDHIHFWTDGCASEFKSNHVFIDRALLKAAADVHHCTCDCNYFCSGHGKGEWDAVGGTCKNAAALFAVREKNDGRMCGVEDLHNFLANNLHVPKARTEGWACRSRAEKTQVLQRVFYLVGRTEVKHSQKSVAAYNVKGVRKLHQIHFPGEKDMKCSWRELSCFCDQCSAQNWSECRNKEMVGVMKDVVLKTRDPNTLLTISGYFGNDHGAAVTNRHGAARGTPAQSNSGDSDDISDHDSNGESECSGDSECDGSVGDDGGDGGEGGDGGDGGEDGERGEFARGQLGYLVEAGFLGSKKPSPNDPPTCYCIIRHDDQEFKDAGYNYYVFRAGQTWEELTKQEQDGYGSVFPAGSRIIRGNYFNLAVDEHGFNESQEQGLYTWDKRAAFVDVESVMVINFTMEHHKALGVYELEGDIHDSAMAALREWEENEEDVRQAFARA